MPDRTAIAESPDLPRKLIAHNVFGLRVDTGHAGKVLSSCVASACAARKARRRPTVPAAAALMSATGTATRAPFHVLRPRMACFRALIAAATHTSGGSRMFPLPNQATSDDRETAQRGYEPQRAARVDVARTGRKGSKGQRPHTGALAYADTAMAVPPPIARRFQSAATVPERRGRWVDREPSMRIPR